MERRAVIVHGIVQGVGFRPFVYGLANRLHLNGFVKNRTGSLLIEVEGDGASLDCFLQELQLAPPPLSRIDGISWQTLLPIDDRHFCIQPSDSDLPGPIFISPDVATCSDCLAELFDPLNRRHGYPFINCTNCGPRLTIIQGVPYDRQWTTMAHFTMCAACRAEYDNPNDRRFHAQPIACPECGPRLNESSAAVSKAVMTGKIAAIKGLGGYHLVCDARSEETVAELRRRKQRDEKPFAVMVRDVAAAERLCAVNAHEGVLLESPRRPIVLLRKAVPAAVCEAVAPDNPYLGVMLPYSPLHHLLLHAVGDVPLVMTSGNRSDEPIAYLDDDAQERLGDIADEFLMHDRPIHVRCDDSVTRSVGGTEQLVRRSRGYAPEPIKLPVACPCPMLAVGGQFKGVFALGRERQAILSHHLGDLDHFEAYQAFERDIGLYEQLFDVRPELIVHDLHPDYASTVYARKRANAEGCRTLAVQHHHAHMASCMAENDLQEPVIGVSFDGTGYGTDGAIWGGELLVGDFGQFQRAAHLRYVRLPGGDKAVREPWRMALSHALDADCAGMWRADDVSVSERRTVTQMIERGFNAPMTSSVGRLFDAVAALAGVRQRVSYEGQAAMQLEWLATDAVEDGEYPYVISPLFRYSGRGAGGEGEAAQCDEIDTRPLIRAVLKDVERGVAANVIARRFHTTLVKIIANVCTRIRESTGLNMVTCSGGVFMNAPLTRELIGRLTQEGFRVFRHRLVPPNDGGLSLGQLAVAAAAIKADG